jgi:hypothetical protein
LSHSRVGTSACCATAGALIIARAIPQRFVWARGLLFPSKRSRTCRRAAYSQPTGRRTYVIYAEPGRQVFFDCRNDVYGLDFVESYLTLTGAQPGWQALAANYAFTVALVPGGQPDRRGAGGSADWRLSYRDSTAVRQDGAAGSRMLEILLRGVLDAAIRQAS